MARRSRQRKEEQSIDITPMLDVVFIMLIFFIVTTSFVKETGIQVTRPEALTAELKERGNILVGIRENGEVWINKSHVEMNAIQTIIERLRAENPEGETVIVADKAADNAVLTQVMQQLARAGIGQVSIAAESRE
ncbi:ExbD/TolR family protein [Pelagicoccus albus]|uniref:Biopolymer transporter ExbD n=1 Tax=Pelagicoccus albus TaxID=415222 RepID=A0A7X1B8V9_9BACT|nr:biopolymer transporter ExbD [Pelagicoccus albus]MBC2607808.1 biopolymer transporter ExbD [Pelagicoccus albus]